MGRSAPETWALTPLRTPLGWWAYATRQDRLGALVLGLDTRRAALALLGRRIGGPWVEGPGIAGLIDRLIGFAAGQPAEFHGVAIDLDGMPAFRRQVLELCAAIPYGRTVTYAQLAAQAGRPRAARAVGRVMATNPIPVVIPCHRVLRSDGSLGGYSAPRGPVLKRRLLDLERANLLWTQDHARGFFENPL